MTHPVRRAQCGQASVEFVALSLLACLAFGALFALEGAVDGRSVGGFMAHHFSCAVRNRCDRAEAALVEAYGARDAAAMRALARVSSTSAASDSSPSTGGNAAGSSARQHRMMRPWMPI